ncbi:MAG: FeoB small GTPase domain-containing protein, partial [Vicingaceae bacterium]|nr:FeoB small GTPase domain-containing protein [Vicingaceae bacterium]
MFNALTGLTQKTGNFPGVTVDKKSGYTSINNQQIEVVDLPGTYSLNPEAEDERVAANTIKNINDDELIIVVADVTNLKRNLFLCTQIIDLGKPVVLVLNMMDLLQKSNQRINLDKISALLQIPVVPVNARIKKGINELKEIVSKYQFKKASFSSDKLTPSERYEKITTVISACLQGGEANRWIDRTKKIDNILTHKIYGYLIFLSILFVIFQAIFSWSAYPMELIEEGFAMLGGLVESWMPKGVLSDLIVNGILAGLSGIVVFVPQIALLFAFIIILEDKLGVLPVNHPVVM